MIRGLIFDFDGLILNTEEMEYAAWEEIFQRHGSHLSEEEWALSMGRSADSFDTVGILEQATGKRYDRAVLKAQAHDRFHYLLSHEPPRPGVLSYLQSARLIGLPVALATSSSRSWAVGHLTRLDLITYFDVICTAEDVARVKPDPGLFLLAAKRLDLPAQDTVAFEDSANGVRAAKDAGCYCVAVPHKLSYLDGQNLADRIIYAMADLPLVDLIDEINRSLQ